MSSTYLITGAAGFIGFLLCLRLLADGHQVRGVDNLNPAYDVRIKEKRLEALREHQGFNFLKADITDRAVLEALPAFAPGAVAVINLAAMAGVRYSTVDPWSYLNTNTMGTLNMLEYARMQGIPKFMQASSSTVYGDQGASPFAETSPTDHPLAPYAASKKSAEVLAYSYHHLYGLDVSVMRFFNVYGAYGRPDMAIFRFCQWIAEGKEVSVTGDGEQTRGLTYIDDIIDGILLALAPFGYEIFNLGGHEVVSINRLIKLLEKELGKEALVRYIPRHPADMPENQADVSKAKQVLGWEPQVGLEEGIKRLVAWYLKNQDWVREIKV